MRFDYLLNTPTCSYYSKLFWRVKTRRCYHHSENVRIWATGYDEMTAICVTHRSCLSYCEWALDRAASVVSTVECACPKCAWLHIVTALECHTCCSSTLLCLLSRISVYTACTVWSVSSAFLLSNS